MGGKSWSSIATKELSNLRRLGIYPVGSGRVSPALQIRSSGLVQHPVLPGRGSFLVAQGPCPGRIANP